MKKIKNDSLQGLEIYLNTEVGIKTHWLPPKQTISVQSHWIGSQVTNLHRRKMVKITNG